MKVLSFNCKGLASSHKKSSLKRLVERIQPDVIFLQETMGDCASVQKALHSLLPGWEFLAMDARGRSGGLAMGWHKARCRFINSWGCFSCLGVDIYSQELNSSFCMINIYGPYQERVVFWEKLFSKSFLSHDRRIMGGDLNFTLGTSEIWGPSAIIDPLVDFFRSHMSRLDLFDLEPAKLNLTWRNCRTGEGNIAKCLDRFLVGEDVAFSHTFLARQWVDWGGEFDHSPIVLDLRGGSLRPPSPFKFNVAWAAHLGYIEIM